MLELKHATKRRIIAIHDLYDVELHPVLEYLRNARPESEN